MKLKPPSLLIYDFLGGKMIHVDLGNSQKVIKPPKDFQAPRSRTVRE